MGEEMQGEIKRKVGQFLLGAVLIISAFYVKDTIGLAVLKDAAFIILLITILADFLRVDLKLSPPFFHNQFVMRNHEKTGVHGATYAFMGCFFAFVFLDFDIALAAISISIFADGLAGIVGKGFGKSRLPNGKSLEGSLTMFITSLLIGMFFLKNIWLITIMAAIAALLELSVNHYPDDLIVPIFTGFGAQLLAALLGLRPLSPGYSIGFVATLLGIAAITILFMGQYLFEKVRGK